MVFPRLGVTGILHLAREMLGVRYSMPLIARPKRIWRRVTLALAE